MLLKHMYFFKSQGIQFAGARHPMDSIECGQTMPRSQNHLELAFSILLRRRIKARDCTQMSRVLDSKRRTALQGRNVTHGKSRTKPPANCREDPKPTEVHPQ